MRRRITNDKKFMAIVNQQTIKQNDAHLALRTARRPPSLTAN